jgi:AraC family transcriptional regulator
MKYFEAGLLRSSAGRGWVGVAAELRNHASGLIADRKTAVDTELAIAVGGSPESVIRRKSGKNLDECAAAPGTVWVCPAGIQEELIEASALTSHILHVYLPKKTIEDLTDDSLRGADAFEYVRYANGYPDTLIAQCGLAIAQELHQQTSTGRILVESIANTIAARLVHSNTGRAPDGAFAAARSGLDTRRLLRVLEAVDADLEGDLSIAHLASVACLSPFHFARAFKTSMGMSPHQYVSARRLHHARDLVVAGTSTLSQIAASLGFSSQANFNRAFKAATGVTPTAYKLALAS